MSDATRTDTLLLRLIDREAGEMLTGSVSLAVRKIAEEIAKDALNDAEFRASLQTLVRERSRWLLDRLLTSDVPPAG